MTSTSSSIAPEQMNIETMTRPHESSLVDTEGGSFLPPLARSPPRVLPTWTSSPHASPASTRRTTAMHPPGSPTAGGRQYHPQHNNNNNNSNNMMAPYSHQHHPQRPLSTYTTLGSPRTTTTRARSASVGNAPYQQKVLPNISPGNPQASGSGAVLLPFLGNLNPEPPEISLERKAMEAASAAERTRAKELEAAEVQMSAEELRAVLKQERHRTAKIQADLAALRSGSVQQQFQAEVLEEGRINGLMRRMDDLQAEKGRIILELEREEEMLTNTLQRKLDEVRREKSQLERQIEQEKNANASLQSQLNALRGNKLVAANVDALEEEEEMEEED